MRTSKPRSDPTPPEKKAVGHARPARIVPRRASERHERAQLGAGGEDDAFGERRGGVRLRLLLEKPRHLWVRADAREFRSEAIQVPARGSRGAIALVHGDGVRDGRFQGRAELVSDGAGRESGIGDISHGEDVLDLRGTPPTAVTETPRAVSSKLLSRFEHDTC